MRKALLAALLCCAALLLSACAAPSALEVLDAFSPEPEADGLTPDLRLLEWSQSTPEQPTVAEAAQDVLRIDLWLDASQVMGGVNPAEKGLYPHKSHKFREGGFHYRYQSEVGMYEGLLRCLLSAGEGSRVRILRAGNERLTDAFLQAQGLSSSDADALRSIRRDMLTYAIDPMPSVLSQMSAEDMTDSFYALASPKMAQVGGLSASLLENPSLAGRMQSALEAQREQILAGEGASLTAERNDTDYPLLYALQNLDLSRLSVITCDPAAIRRLTDVDASGQSIALVEQALRERGVFDAGLCVELYAFTLDYLGQMTCYGAADFAEPLVWGKLDYSTRKKSILGALPMPRTLLMLVIGTPQQVDAYTERFQSGVSASAAFTGLRGPDKGQLTYTQGDQTVTQEPFGFAQAQTRVQRPDVRSIASAGQGAVLAAQNGSVQTQDGYATATLSGADTLTLTVPTPTLPSGMQGDFSALVNVQATVTEALLLSRVEENTPNEAALGEQIIRLRDKQYVFTRQDAAFADGLLTSPLRVSGIVLSQDGAQTSVTLAADGALLTPGWYRVSVSADVSGAQFSWDSVPWVAALDATLTNEQISVWEQFAQAIHDHDGNAALVPRQFQHAWGPATDRSYHGLDVPDCPPVTKAQGLSQLLGQLQSAANIDTVPYVRYVFDVYVPGTLGGEQP